MESWRCFFANESYARTNTPMFLLNSALDSWQMKNIWQGDLHCSTSKLTNCNGSAIRRFNGYLTDFVDALQMTEKFGSPGEGGFIDSCFEHCSAADPNTFGHCLVNNMSMRDALAVWWASGSSFADTSQKWYLPSFLNVDTPHRCS